MIDRYIIISRNSIHTLQDEVNKRLEQRGMCLGGMQVARTIQDTLIYHQTMIVKDEKEIDLGGERYMQEEQ